MCVCVCSLLLLLLFTMRVVVVLSCVRSCIFVLGGYFFFHGNKKERNDAAVVVSFPSTFNSLLTGEMQVDYRGASVLYAPLKTIPITL